MLSELYLKCAIIHGTERYPLPLLPHELAFIRKNRYGGETYTVGLWFESERLCFVDLRNPTLRRRGGKRQKFGNCSQPVG